MYPKSHSRMHAVAGSPILHTAEQVTDTILPIENCYTPSMADEQGTPKTGSGIRSRQPPQVYNAVPLPPSLPPAYNHMQQPAYPYPDNPNASFPGSCFAPFHNGNIPSSPMHDSGSSYHEPPTLGHPTSPMVPQYASSGPMVDVGNSIPPHICSTSGNHSNQAYSIHRPGYPNPTVGCPPNSGGRDVLSVPPPPFLHNCEVGATYPNATYANGGPALTPLESGELQANYIPRYPHHDNAKYGFSPESVNRGNSRGSSFAVHMNAKANHSQSFRSKRDCPTAVGTEAEHPINSTNGAKQRPVSRLAQSTARFQNLYDEHHKLSKNRSKVRDETVEYRRDQRLLKDELSFYRSQLAAAESRRDTILKDYQRDVIFLLRLVNGSLDRLCKASGSKNLEATELHKLKCAELDAILSTMQNTATEPSASPTTPDNVKGDTPGSEIPLPVLSAMLHLSYDNLARALNHPKEVVVKGTASDGEGGTEQGRSDDKGSTPVIGSTDSCLPLMGETRHEVADPETSAAKKETEQRTLLDAELSAAVADAQKDLQAYMATLGYGLPLTTSGACNLQLSLEIQHCHAVASEALIDTS